MLNCSSAFKNSFSADSWLAFAISFFTCASFCFSCAVSYFFFHLSVSSLYVSNVSISAAMFLFTSFTIDVLTSAMSRFSFALSASVAMFIISCASGSVAFAFISSMVFDTSSNVLRSADFIMSFKSDFNFPVSCNFFVMLEALSP